MSLTFLKGREFLHPGWRPRLVVMAKPPMMGRVKTRLARGVGSVMARKFYSQSLKLILDKFTHKPQFDLVLALDRIGSHQLPLNWPQNIPIILQPKGDLGVRMGHFFTHMPKGPVVIIGTDCPQLPLSYLHSAFKSLGNHDGVIGPSHDGGYWLIGQKRSPKTYDLFDQVRWSSKYTLKDTLKNGRGMSIYQLPILQDVDEMKDLKAIGNLWQRFIM